MQILLHKQRLSKQQLAKLTAEGVVAIRTDDPESFRFLDVRVPQIQMNDMIWACLDAVNEDRWESAPVTKRLAKNLLRIAQNQRTDAARPSSEIAPAK
jgi:hypothetical protein